MEDTETNQLCLTTIVVDFAPVASFAQKTLLIQFLAALAATQVVVQRNVHHVMSL